MSERELWDMAGERMLEAVEHALRGPTYHALPGTWEWKAAESLARMGLVHKTGRGVAGRIKYIRTAAGDRASVALTEAP